MSPQYTLYYFKFRARGEPIRWLFHYAGQPFEEVCVEIGEWNNGWKHKTPFKLLPMLEVKEDDGVTLVLSETTAILRYLGHKFGLEAETAEERALCDMAEYISADITPRTLRYFWTYIGLVPEDQRPELYKNAYLPTVKEVGETFEKQRKKNGMCVLVGKKATWVDFLLAAYVEMMMKGAKNPFKEYPLVKKHYKTVSNWKGVKEHIERRPDYPF
ncbi:CRE-GST-6 protein [Aphelenchoides avenae]|nr:CRE-GST-6 protein [Aphelenchus avenae]